MPNTTITIEQHSASNSSSRSNSFTDGEGSSGTGVHVSSASAAESGFYSDETEEWEGVHSDDIEPSDSASRSRTSQRYRENERPPARRELPSRRHTTNERPPARHHSESRIHRRPAPRPPSSVDPSEDFPAYGRGAYPAPPQSHFGPRPAPGYAQTSYSGGGYAPPFGAPGAMIPFAQQGGYQYPGHGPAQNPFSPSPPPPGGGAGYFNQHAGLHSMPGHVASPYGVGDMIPSPYQQQAYHGYGPGFMPPPMPPHVAQYANYHQWSQDPGAESDSEHQKKLAAEKKAAAEQLDAERKAAADKVAEMEKKMKEHEESVEKAKKEADELVAKAKKDAAEKAKADREAEIAAAKAAEEAAMAAKKEIDDAVKKERERMTEKAAADKKAAAKKAEEEAEKAVADQKAAEEKAAADKKAIEDAVAKAKAEMESKIVSGGGDADKKKPIKFKDAVGRKFSFPFHLCQTWAGMEELIRQAFLHVETIGPHVADGHYDLIGPNGEIILPQVWETMIEPDWSITMLMWPIPEPKPAPPPPPPGPGPFGPGPGDRPGRPNDHRRGPPPPGVRPPPGWNGPPRPPGLEEPIIVVGPSHKTRSSSGNNKKKAAPTGGFAGWFMGTKPKQKPKKK